MKDSKLTTLQAELIQEAVVSGTRRRRGRIMAVDDDERNLLALGEVLEPIGEVLCVKSGEDALRYLLREEFAVILLDVLMPGMDGYETAGLIRNRKQSNRTPIIFLSAINKEDAHLIRGYDAGAVDYVFKPFDPVILRSKVSVFMELHDKTLEIQEKAAHERRLVEASLLAHSEKLEAQHALRRAEARQDTILRALPVVFHSRSTQSPHNTLFISHSIRTLGGYDPQEILSEPGLFNARIHPDDRHVFLEAHAQADAHGSYTCEYRWQALDGSWKVILDQGVVSFDADSGSRTIFGTLLDVTERRNLEEQLAQARKLETLGQLTGGVAHDFNNLLASIMSGLSIIERRADLPPKASEVLEMTRHAATQGVELINRMLAFSRRQQLRPATIRVSEFMIALERMISPILGGLVRLQWQAGSNAGSVFADPNQLELALMNLVINSRDATPRGGTISVRADNRQCIGQIPRLNRGQYVVFTVEDTGVGIPPDKIDKVIEPFFTTKSVGKGTGLGLSTVYGFAQQSGGGLHIRSEVGRGTVIELWLPASTHSGIEAPDTVDAPPDARVHVTNSKSLEILLVDDYDLLRELTAEMLQHNGYSVCTASGGAEALSLMEKNPSRFDLIITDFAMPLISGLDVVRYARSLRADWPAIIITGYVDSAAISERPSDVPLLNKPVSDEVLLGTIAECLQPRAERPEPEMTRSG